MAVAASVTAKTVSILIFIGLSLVRLDFSPLDGNREPALADEVREEVYTWPSRFACRGVQGFTDEAWYGLLAPAKTPPEIVARLTESMKKVMASPELRAQLEKVGARPVGNSPAEFIAQVRNEVARMKQLVRERQNKLDE